MAEGFLDELKKLKQPVWKTLQMYLPSGSPKDHYKMVKDYPERQGKYLRPGLLLLATSMLGGSQEKALLLAASIQASEDWLLIHDDIEDKSEFRRSTDTQPRPALHKLYGTDLALNAGDSLHIIMWRILGDAVEKIGGELGWKIFRKVNDILLTTTEGQFQDLYWIKHNVLNISTADYYRMVYKKSAYYSIIGPLQLGAMAAGQVSAKIQKSIEQWAEPLGYAFQIRDDLINLTQVSSVLGKEQGGDILEGKRTLMLIHLLQHCSQSEETYIAAIYGKPRAVKTKAEVKYVLGLMEKYGSLAYAVKTIATHCKQAEQGFAKFALHFPDSKAKHSLRQAISFIGQRTS
jgi:geranylgeranyl diphosphate synthase, type II